MSPGRLSTYDVAIAGAGPVGLFLACELRLAGVSVLVLEGADDPRTPLKALPFGLRGLSTATLETFDRRGLLKAVEAAQRASLAESARDAAAHWMGQQRRPAGHFAGIQFFRDDVDPARWPYRLAGPHDAPMAVDMQSLEQVLETRAAAMGAEIRRGVRVEEIDQVEDGASIHTSRGRFEAGWLVGCDGGRSAVRKAGGFAFDGTDPEFTGYSLEATLANPDALPVGRTLTPTGMYTFAKPGTIALVDFDGGAMHRAEPITLERAQAVLRRVSGTDVDLVALRQAATWTDRACQATDYRRGRVLLAGDAAHIHSPLGGQGLNLGLGDAFNLGWKLGATIRGDAPDGLLDTYGAERHPEGARILDWSRAQVVLMRPTPAARALQSVLRDLIATRDGATYFAERMSGVSLRHGLDAGHPLAGRSVPDFAFDDGRRVAEMLRDGGGLLLDFDCREQLRMLADRWRGRMTYVAGGVQDRLGLRAVLVRPDGVVAWASDLAAPVEDLLHAASRWFGEPDRSDSLGARAAAGVTLGPRGMS